MSNRGFSKTENNIETPNDTRVAEKLLHSSKIKTNRVDINILKSKLKENESREFKKNLYVLSTLILFLGILGIYLSL